MILRHQFKVVGIVAVLLLPPHVFGQQAEIVPADVPYLTVSRTLPGSGADWELHLVATRDEIYVPIGLRKPEGSGPFPIILMGSGQGRDGVTKIDDAMTTYQGLMDRLVARGYAAAFVSYRNEVPFFYNQIGNSELLTDDVSGGDRTLQSLPALDSDDFLSIVSHVRALSYINADAVGAIGSSHSGEIILKATTVIDLAAAVPSEAAAIEFLEIDIAQAPRDSLGKEVQLQEKEAVRALSDKEPSMERIRRINTPMLVLGRDDDHLQGICELVYEWLAEAGAPVTWASFDHPEHGYSLLGDTGTDASAADETQEQVFELYMSFFDQHLMPASNP